MKRLWMKKLKNRQTFFEIAEFLVEWYNKKFRYYREMVRDIVFNFKYEKEFEVVTHLGKLKVNSIEFDPRRGFFVQFEEFGGLCVEIGYSAHYRDYTYILSHDIIFNEALYQAPDDFWQALEREIHKKINENTRNLNYLRELVLRDKVLERFAND